jgi:hypothetical protein
MAHEEGEEVEDMSVWSVDANGGETICSPARRVYRPPQDTFSHMNAYSAETQQWCESCNEFVNDRNHMLPITVKNRMGERRTNVVRCQAISKKNPTKKEKKIMPTPKFPAQDTPSPAPPTCNTVGVVQVKEPSPSSLLKKKILHTKEFEDLGVVRLGLVRCPGLARTGGGPVCLSYITPRKLKKHLRKFHQDVNPDQLYCNCGVVVRIEHLAGLLGIGDTKVFHPNCRRVLLTTKPPHTTILPKPANAPEAMAVLPPLPALGTKDETNLINHKKVHLIEPVGGCIGIKDQNEGKKSLLAVVVADKVGLHWVCTVCRVEVLESLEALQRHEAKAHGNKCNSCERRFVQKSDLKRHKYRDHREKSGVRVCDICNQVVERKSWANHE